LAEFGDTLTSAANGDASGGDADPSDGGASPNGGAIDGASDVPSAPLQV